MTDYTPTTDWRQIDTSTEVGQRELNIEIAKRVGYRFERPAWMSEGSAHIYHPNGHQMYQDMSGWPGRRTPVFEAADIANALPRYTEDLNAAAGLPMTGHSHMQIIIYANSQTLTVLASNEIGYEASGAIILDTPGMHVDVVEKEALARCKAWLAWHDASTLGA